MSALSLLRGTYAEPERDLQPAYVSDLYPASKAVAGDLYRFFVRLNPPTDDAQPCRMVAFIPLGLDWPDARTIEMANARLGRGEVVTLGFADADDAGGFLWAARVEGMRA